MLNRNKSARTASNCRAAGLIAAAGLIGAVVPVTASAPASAAVRPTAGHAVTGDALLTLEALGLVVVVNDGFIAASGPAAIVRVATGLFAAAGDYALYTGQDETGTGYLALTYDNPVDWVELQIPSVVTIGSITNDTTDNVGWYTDSAGTGTLTDEERPESTSNFAATAARTDATPYDSGAEGVAVGSPGIVSGNVIQVPVHIPINLCGNSIDVIGLLNPASGNICVNA
jgi:hypothetical protein